MHCKPHDCNPISESSDLMGRVLLLAAAAAVVLGGDPVAKNWEPQNDDEKLLKFRIKPMKSYVSSALIVGSATGLQMVTPGWVASVGGGETLQKCAGWLVGMRKDHPLAMVSAHGLLTKGCADLLAQTIPNGAAPAVWIDQLRLVRSTLASLISTSLPFYYWTKVMARWFRNYKTTVLSSGVVGSKILSSTFVTSLVKTTVTQALFRPINVFLFLALQSIFRGDSARQLVDTIKKKFKGSLIGGVVFYSVSNLLMYSVPIPFLHPIMGSIAGLIFNVWLAIVAYKKS